MDQLRELANKYHSDKGSTYMCGHTYTDYYNKIFAPYQFNSSPFNLLEIGLNRDNQDSAPSLQIYRELFGGKANLFGFDIHPGFRKFNDPENNTHILIGDQSDPAALISECYGRQYDIIIDDGYHASKHQQISLSILWHLLKPGGVYVIEDLHFQPDPLIETSTPTKQLIRSWRDNSPVSTAWISDDMVSKIRATIDHIEMYDSQSKYEKWTKEALTDAFAIIYKKQ